MIPIVILAAGRSKRMGSTNKLTMPLGGKQVLDYAVEAALESKADSVLVVTNDAQIIGRHDGATYIPADLAHLGQSHSIAAGIAHVHHHLKARGALLALGDMPFLTAKHIDLVLQKAQTEPNTIWRPVHNGQPGHPVYWPKHCFSALETLEGDDGARPLLQRLEGQIRPIGCGDDGVVFDVDTPGRFAAAKARLSSAL